MAMISFLPLPYKYPRAPPSISPQPPLNSCPQAGEFPCRSSPFHRRLRKIPVNLASLSISFWSHPFPRVLAHPLNPPPCCFVQRRSRTTKLAGVPHSNHGAPLLQTSSSDAAIPSIFSVTRCPHRSLAEPGDRQKPPAKFRAISPSPPRHFR